MKLIKSVRFKQGLKIIPRWIEFKVEQFVTGASIKYAKKD